MHASLFAALALTTHRRFGRGLLLVLLYALVSEVLQAALPLGRDGNAADLLADVVGAASAWMWCARHPSR